MWNGKNKAVSFSFDDGVSQDRRLVEILNKYGLKATFNLCSAWLGNPEKRDETGKRITNGKVFPGEVRSLYAGHEVAGHALTHPDLTQLPDETVAYQAERDRLILSDLCGVEVVGFAYPYGAANERVAHILKTQTGIKYARTVESSRNFAKQSDLILFKPTEYFMNTESLFSLAEAFLNAPDDGEDRLFYIWGHAYELDGENGISWEKFEDFCRLISGKTNMFYGTNKEVLL